MEAIKTKSTDATIRNIDGSWVVFYNEKQRWNGYTHSWNRCADLPAAIKYCNDNGLTVINELPETEEVIPAQEYNRASAFQCNKTIFTVSMEWNEEEAGYIVYLHDTNDGDKEAQTKPQGFIQANADYRHFCRLTMETVFNMTVYDTPNSN